MSFKGKEIPVYESMEEYLVETLKIPTRSDLYKKGLKTLYRQTKALHMELI